jgi:hypothetical protein
MKIYCAGYNNDTMIRHYGHETTNQIDGADVIIIDLVTATELELCYACSSCKHIYGYGIRLGYNIKDYNGYVADSFEACLKMLNVKFNICVCIHCQGMTPAINMCPTCKTRGFINKALVAKILSSQ